MAHFVAPFALLALALAATASGEPAQEALEGLALDDACSALPAGEACSASFRQLRGLSVRGAAAGAAGVERAAAIASEAEDVDSEPGICCYSAEDQKDVCGTCYTSSIATDSQCSKKSQCAGCGGTWCRSGCVMGAADPSHKCDTAFPTGIAKRGTFCATDAASCSSCNGQWCKVISTSKKGHSDASEKASKHGFCCYRAEGDDKCGDCADIAKDETCSTEAHCGTCGGTWCAGPKCIIASKDPADKCGSAFSHGIAADDSYCSHSEEACSNCNGAWCPDATIKYADKAKGVDSPGEGPAGEAPASPEEGYDDAASPTRDGTEDNGLPVAEPGPESEDGEDDGKPEADTENDEWEDLLTAGPPP